MRIATLVLALGALVLGAAVAAAEPQAVKESNTPGEASAAEMPEVEPGAAPVAPDAPEPEAAPEANLPQEAAEAADPGAEVEPLAAIDDEAEAAEGETAAVETAGAEAAPAPESAKSVTLGEVGYDREGRRGYVHVVARGDTLWDISEAYLGTPWVWPDIWNDNDAIDDPHLIRPGDRIWITPSEMRPVTAEEAEALLAGAPASGAPAAEPAAPEDAPALPEAEPAPAQPPTYRVSSREHTGLLSEEAIEASISIVEGQPPRTLLGFQDEVWIGAGEGQVEAGDQFRIVRPAEKVSDPDSLLGWRSLGYHVEYLGWLEVKEVHPETSLAEVRMSVREIHEGDRLVPREPFPTEIVVREGPSHVEGSVSFFSDARTAMGTVDYVYLNRGTRDGLEVGSPLVVFAEGRKVEETARGDGVRIPDQPIAQLLVVKAQPETSIAFITHTEEPIQVGDRFRGAE